MDKNLFLRGFVLLLHENGKLKLAEEDGETIVFTSRKAAIEWVKVQYHTSFDSKIIPLNQLLKNP